MTSALVTIKMTPTDFDYMRSSLEEFRDGFAQIVGDTAATSVEKSKARAEAMKLNDLLGKLG